MKCDHKDIYNYGTEKWCKNCGAFKPNNHVHWMIPNYISRDAEFKLMKNREIEDGKADGTRKNDNTG